MHPQTSHPPCFQTCTRARGCCWDPQWARGWPAHPCHAEQSTAASSNTPACPKPTAKAGHGFLPPDTALARADPGSSSLGTARTPLGARRAPTALSTQPGLSQEGEEFSQQLSEIMEMPFRSEAFYTAAGKALAPSAHPLPAAREEQLSGGCYL